MSFLAHLALLVVLDSAAVAAIFSLVCLLGRNHS